MNSFPQETSQYLTPPVSSVALSSIHHIPQPPGRLNAGVFFWRTHGIVHLRVLKHLKQRQDHHNLGGFCWREIRCGPELKQKATTSFSKWL